MRTTAGSGIGLLRFLWTHPGLRGARVSAFRRAAVWQVAKRLGARRAHVRVGPAQLYCYPGSAGGSAVLYAGLPDWKDMLFAIRCLRPGERFVDVGANIGAYSALVSGYRPGVEVTAVEPDAQARHRLVENLELNGIKGEIVPAALGREAGRRRFTLGRDTVNRLAVTEAEAAVSVEMRTLDDVVGTRAVSLVKIDVEGAELEVFRGGRELLSRADAPELLFELNADSSRYGATVSAIREHLAALGYEMFDYVPERDALVPFTGETPPPSGNVVATKDAPALARRLAERAAGGVVSVPVDVHMRIERKAGSGARSTSD